jgi:uncharacterized protein (TIGR03435 family)
MRPLTVVLTLVSMLILNPVIGAPPDGFEVASVRISPPRENTYTSFPKWEGAQFTATNISMRVLVELAFDVQENQISGIDRLGTEKYDVFARAPGAEKVTYERAQPLLRQLLAERFALATHRETKDTPGYALVAGKGAPKLKAVSEPRPMIIYATGLEGSPMSLDALAATIARPVGRPVVNNTGIAGTYDIKLRYAASGATSTTDSNLPSIFTAVEEQLGLKLESRRVPLEMLVIDHCERVPTEN